MAIKTVQVTINGVPTTLTLNSSTGKYEATITAPAKSSYNQSGGYYNVTVKATDTAGNSTSKDATDATLGSKLKLVVKEKVAPTITVTYPTASATTTNNKPTFKWKVTDDDSGVDQILLESQSIVAQKSHLESLKQLLLVDMNVHTLQPQL